MKRVLFLVLALIVLVSSSACVFSSDPISSVSKGSFDNSQNRQNSSADKHTSSHDSSSSLSNESDTSSDVSNLTESTPIDESDVASGNESSDITGDGNSTGNGDGDGNSNGNGDGNGDGNGSGSGNGSNSGNSVLDSFYEDVEISPLPITDTDYIESPTDADIQEFYKFIDAKVLDYYGAGLFWPEMTDSALDKMSALYFAQQYYYYYGNEIEYLENNGTGYGTGCGDPLGRFVIPEKRPDDYEYCDYYVTATAYDIEALNWISEHILNKTVTYPDDNNGYCHEGKYYEADYYYGAWGHPGNCYFDQYKSYKYIGNGQYVFNFYYETAEPDTGFRTCFRFIAMPKYDAKVGTYWRLLFFDQVKREQYEVDW